MNAHIADTHADLVLIVDRLLAHARNDTALAAALRRQARRVLELLGEETSATGQKIPTTVRSSPPASADNLDRLVSWSLGDRRETGGGVLVQGEPLDHTEFPGDRHRELADHCRLGARAAVWRARALIGDDAPFSERERLIQEAGDAGVFLWTVTRQPGGGLSRNAGDYQRLADAYTACAEALDAWDRIPMEQAREILTLIAEAQSMIRVAAASAGHHRPENTAVAVYQWLRTLAADIRVYIPRYMRPNQVADPDLAGDLRERVAGLLAPVRADLPPPTRVEDPGVTGDEDDGEDEPPTPEVARVRELLRYRTVAMFCGKRQPRRQQQLIDAFELNDLLWEDVTGKYNNGDHAWIFNRPDLELVIVAKGWLSHGHTYTLPKLAAERGVPVVRLPGGYGVNRVAHEILEQVSERLTESA